MYLGIEIGGTKLQIAAGAAGELAQVVRLDVAAARGAEGILEQLATAVPPLVERHAPRGLGIGFGGPIDSAAGTVTTSHQIDGWDGVPLAAWCRDRFGIPCTLANDCDSAALAEATWGAARGAETMFYVTVGTGVGGGLVSGGRLMGRQRPAVAEIGHLRPGLDATDSHDTVEARASGRGIETFVRELLEQGDGDTDALELLARAGGDPEAVTARAVAEAAAGGNAVALSALDRGCRTLGWAVAQVVTLIAPETVVIGGGVSLAGEELFFGPVRRYFAEYVFPPLRGSCQIVPAALGEEVVLYGAIALAEAADAPPAT